MSSLFKNSFCFVHIPFGSMVIKSKLVTSSMVIIGSNFSLFTIIIIIVIIINILFYLLIYLFFNRYKLFWPNLTVAFSLKSEWLQVSSVLQDFSKYSSWFSQRCGLDGLNSFSDLIFYFCFLYSTLTSY